MKTEPTYFWYAESLTDAEVAFSEHPTQIRLTQYPPYIVAESSLYALYCAPWGHEVWRVKVLETGDMSNINNDAGYLRAVAIEKIEVIDRARLFGSHGSGVVEILDRVQQLSLEQVQFLAKSSTESTLQQAIKNKVIQRWCQDYAPHRYDLNEDWTNILAVPDAREGMVSPVAQGLSILHDLWRQLAQRLEGDAAWEIDPLFVADEDDEPSYVWTPLWRDAYHQVESAVLSYSHLEYATLEERQFLRQGWNAYLQAFAQ